MPRQPAEPVARGAKRVAQNPVSSYKGKKADTYKKKLADDKTERRLKQVLKEAQEEQEEGRFLNEMAMQQEAYANKVQKAKDEVDYFKITKKVKITQGDWQNPQISDSVRTEVIHEKRHRRDVEVALREEEERKSRNGREEDLRALCTGCKHEPDYHGY